MQLYRDTYPRLRETPAWLLVRKPEDTVCSADIFGDIEVCVPQRG